MAAIDGNCFEIEQIANGCYRDFGELEADRSPLCPLWFSLFSAVARAEDTATAQRDGLIRVRAASARKEELKAVSSEIVRTVRVMDGRNRQRFAEEGQLLGSWFSAGTVLGTPRPDVEPEGGTPAGGEVRPAA